MFVADRWNGLRMMLVAAIAIIFLGRLLFHISSIALVLFILLVFLVLLFYAGTQSLFRR
jgi:hypothetical protein